jgi:hypothetical protein
MTSLNLSTLTPLELARLQATLDALPAHWPYAS